jgi:hypothetical protein
VLDIVASKSILCSGVTFGTYLAVVHYVRLMHGLMFESSAIAFFLASGGGGSSANNNNNNNNENSRNVIIRNNQNDIFSYQELAQHSRFPRCERNGVDQGVHNVVIHLQTLQWRHNFIAMRGIDRELVKSIPKIQVIIWAHAKSPIVNMQAGIFKVSLNSNEPKKDPLKIRAPNLVFLSNKLEVLNENGNRVAIAHQYDRHHEFQQSLFAEVYCIFLYHMLNSMEL